MTLQEIQAIFEVCSQDLEDRRDADGTISLVEAAQFVTGLPDDDATTAVGLMMNAAIVTGAANRMDFYGVLALSITIGLHVGRQIGIKDAALLPHLDQPAPTQRPPLVSSPPRTKRRWKVWK